MQNEDLESQPQPQSTDLLIESRQNTISSVHHYPTELKLALKRLGVKSSSLLLVNAIMASSDFLKSYLLMKFGGGISSLGINVITSTVINFTVNTIAVLPNPGVVLIAEEFGAIEKLLQESNEMLEASEEEQLDIKTKIENSRRKIGSLFRQSWFIGAVSSVPTMIILFSIKPILQGLGQSEELSNLARVYLLPVAFSVPIQIMLNINERAFPAVDKEKWLIPYKVIMSGIGIGLSLYFIPNYGVLGAGSSLAIQSFIELAGTILFISLNNDLKAYSILTYKNFSRSDIPYFYSSILKQGFPLMLEKFTMSISGFFISLIIGKMGSIRMGVEQIVNQYMSLVTMVTKAINEATNRLIAQAVGKKAYWALRLQGNLNLIMSMSLYTLAVSSYNIFPLALASAFLDKDLIEDNSTLIKYTFLIISGGRFFDLLQDLSSANLAGLQDTFISSGSLLAAAIAIMIPLCLISYNLTNFDLYGINASLMIGFAIASSFSMFQWVKLSNQIVEKDKFDPKNDTSNSRFLAKFSILCSRAPKTNDLPVGINDMDGSYQCNVSGASY